jgi:hypothetical protein
MWKEGFSKKTDINTILQGVIEQEQGEFLKTGQLRGH